MNKIEKITEQYVSLKVATLLKEKGFNIPCSAYYIMSNKSKTSMPKIAFDLALPNNTYLSSIYKNIETISLPTHQLAMKWLREIYNIEISITYGFPWIRVNGKSQYKYFWSIVKVCDDHLEYPMNKPESMNYIEEQADTYEQAIDDALIYVLENFEEIKRLNKYHE